MIYKKIISVVLLILGLYYLLVSIQIIPSEVIFGNFHPTNKTLSIISIIIIAIGIAINSDFRKKIKNAFS